MFGQIARAVVGSFLGVALLVAPAVAQSPHFVRGPNYEDLGTQLQATGSVAGLGNENIDVILTAVGTATVTCTNPGGNVAPGQTQTITATGEATNLEVKNGRVNFTVTTATPEVSADACPNPRWTPTVTDVEFTSATLEIIQPAGSGIVVLTDTVTF